MMQLINPILIISAILLSVVGVYYTVRHLKKKTGFSLKAQSYCYLGCAACWYLVAFMRWRQNDTGTAITYFCLGNVYLCLAPIVSKKKENDSKNQ